MRHETMFCHADVAARCHAMPAICAIRFRAMPPLMLMFSRHAAMPRRACLMLLFAFIHDFFAFTPLATAASPMMIPLFSSFSRYA